MTTPCKRKSQLTSMLLSETSYELDHLNAGLLVWQELANKWQSCAEARKRALDSLTVENRLLRRAMWASGIVSAVVTGVAIVGWVR